MFGINKQCGFEAKDLKEVRVVSHDEARGLGFEVWVFNDPLSQRDDKITAISVILKSYTKHRWHGYKLQNSKRLPRRKTYNIVFGK